MTLRDDCRDLARPWIHAPWRRLGIELRALKLTCLTVPENNDARKYITLVFVLTWATLTVLIGTERVPDPSAVYYGPFTALVFLLVGRMWGVEVERLLAGFNVPTESDDDDK